MIKIVAAGTNTATAVTCSDSGIAAAVLFKKATVAIPTKAPTIPIFLGLCIVLVTSLSFTNKIAAAQLGTIRWVTSCVKAPAPTAEAQALKKKPKPKEKCDAGSPCAAFISPNVLNAPNPCVCGA